MLRTSQSVSELESYAEESLIELWNLTYKEDYTRRGYKFKESKKMTVEDNKKIVDMYKDLF